ncbi:DUF4407 domain-containing protein [Bacteroides sp. GM023]|uniref:DUF4407 domain-containing protein n=1 Tax=Bacteroides sp. GM023 TaxID=2723058 RepID=UPI00168BF68C|nr:DUF4407 domain-containing protein [Bacteroides sp. GM023]MBD3592717.1 DUF4407 domain-containing protein [Bacteroides sp. GM023]
MKWWLKFGCFLTGWNSRILSQCSEASFKHLKKYTSALLILIILWGFTGYCFAQRYVGAPQWGCILSAFIFVIIVIQIERQIILTVGSNWWSTAFRLFIAIIMSLLGSAILDQIIFGDDIDRKMVEITDRQVQEQLPLRLNVIDTKLAELQVMVDSLDKLNLKLNEEISQKPTITTVATTTTYTREMQPDGSYKEVPQNTISRIPIANPRTQQVTVNDSTLKRLRLQQDEYTLRKISVENDLRKELSSSTGFLDELRAMLEIVITRPEALVFYIIIFCFLISLELFVVTSKLGDKKCDYDLIVEHQLEIKKTTLEELVKKINQKK